MPPASVALLGEARISYDSLAKYLPGISVSSERIHLPNASDLSIDIRLAQIPIRDSDSRMYTIVFVFDKHRKNRLLLLSPDMIQETIHYLLDNHICSCASCILVIGKEGSRRANSLVSVFSDFGVSKVCVLDYDGKTPLKEFLASLLVDFDRVETRSRTLADPVRVDLTSLPLSEKRVRLLEDQSNESKSQIIFANQLLQISGLSERSSTSIAETYKRPIHLMHEIIRGGDLHDFSYLTAKGETTTLNSRIRGILKRVFGETSSPDDLVS